MLYAVKANRHYKITEGEKQKYIDQGCKIAELKDGKLVFEKVEKDEKVEELIKERTVLKGQLTKANNRVSELEKEIEEIKGEGK